MEIVKHTKKIYEIPEHKVGAIVSDLQELWDKQEISEDSKELVRLFTDN